MSSFIPKTPDGALFNTAGWERLDLETPAPLPPESPLPSSGPPSPLSSSSSSSSSSLSSLSAAYSEGTDSDSTAKKRSFHDTLDADDPASVRRSSRKTRRPHNYAEGQSHASLPNEPAPTPAKNPVQGLPTPPKSPSPPPSSDETLIDLLDDLESQALSPLGNVGDTVEGPITPLLESLAPFQMLDEQGPSLYDQIAAPPTPDLSSQAGTPPLPSPTAIGTPPVITPSGTPALPPPTVQQIIGSMSLEQVLSTMDLLAKAHPFITDPSQRQANWDFFMLLHNRMQSKQ